MKDHERITRMRFGVYFEEGVNQDRLTEYKVDGLNGLGPMDHSFTWGWV